MRSRANEDEIELLVKAERVQGDNFGKARESAISSSENRRHEESDMSIVKQQRKLEKNTRYEICKFREFEEQNERGRRPRKSLASRALVHASPYK